MNITVNATALAQELRLINQIVLPKPTIPILTNLLLRADDNLYLYATDLEVGFYTVCRAQITETGAITLPAKRLLDLLEQLPDADLQLYNEGPHVYLVSGAFRSRLQSLPAEDYPTQFSPTGESFTLATAALQLMIERIRYAVTEKGMFNGAQLMITENSVGLVSTDGKRLSLTIKPHRQGLAATALIPAKTLDALKTVFDGNEVTFSQSEQHLFFRSGHRLLTSRMLVGQFPSYQRIIPQDNEHKAVILRSSLMAGLRRVICVSAEGQQVSLAFAPGTLQLRSLSEIGEAEEDLSIIYDGPVLRVATNAQFLLDFLEAAIHTETYVYLKDGISPLLLTDGEDFTNADFINVVMLIRA